MGDIGRTDIGETAEACDGLVGNSTEPTGIFAGLAGSNVKRAGNCSAANDWETSAKLTGKIWR